MESQTQGRVITQLQLRRRRDVGGHFNAGNFQGDANAAIAGIGKDAVDDAGVIPGTTPYVQLGVLAFLGAQITSDGLGAVNFKATLVRIAERGG